MAAGDLTTLDNVKGWLGLSVPPAGTAAPTYIDTLLTRLIAAASAFIQIQISRTIALQAYTEVRNGYGTAQMMLKNVPIVTLTSLSINGIAIQARPALGPGATTGPGGGYTFDDQIIYLSGYEFCRGAQNVSVAYTAGYADTPPDLEQACIDMIGDWFRYRDRIGKLSEGIEGQTISFTNSDIPARSRGVLLGYKRVTPVF